MKTLSSISLLLFALIFSACSSDKPSPTFGFQQERSREGVYNQSPQYGNQQQGVHIQRPQSGNQQQGVHIQRPGSDVIAVKCSSCNGTGQVFDFELGINTMCPNCINGVQYVSRSAVHGKQPSFGNNSNACTLCRTTYCSNYKGVKEMNAICQNPSCHHTWQQHKW